MTDQDLEAAHDQLAENTVVGVSFFLDELHRRELARSAEQAQKLARAAFWVSVSSTLLALVSVVVALFVGR